MIIPKVTQLLSDRTKTQAYPQLLPKLATFPFCCIATVLREAGSNEYQVGAVDPDY